MARKDTKNAAAAAAAAAEAAAAASAAVAAEYVFMYILLPNINEHKLASLHWNS